MSNLFIKREVKVDGMPKYPAWYFVDTEREGMNVSYLDKTMRFSLDGVIAWLEPVSLPTEEERVKVAQKIIEKTGRFTESALMHYDEYIMSFLTNTNQS